MALTKKRSKAIRKQPAPALPAPEEKASPANACPVAGIGASAGGLEAFSEMLHHLPVDAGIAFVFVQHLDPVHPSILAELLARHTSMPVCEARDAMRLEPDRVYVMPPNANMEIAGGSLHLTSRTEEHGQHLPIDRFFRSLAKECGNRAIAVILSGTASDGSLGLAAIKAAGGITLAQDEGSAKYDGMPRAAVASGCVDFIAPPREIAAELGRIGCHPYVVSGDPPRPTEEDEIRKILTLVRTAKGLDFSLYKQSTVLRRVRRRMLLKDVGTPSQYLKTLESNPKEVQALFDDILINVTEFFRDPESFRVLKNLAWPVIVQDRPGNAPIRIWVPGCSTGEEVYSIAMCLTEYLEEARLDIAIQIFATDISESVIDKSRAGLYPENIAADIAPDRLRRFFVKVDRGYEIAKRIRDICVFARHNLFKDPPFSRLDLISCRNVLIYLDGALQKQIIPTLHYSLKPNGFLMLGNSETVGTYSDLFGLVDSKHKVYRKKFSAVRKHPEFSPALGPSGEASVRTRTQPEARSGAWNTADLQREADRLVLSQFGPPGVLIDDSMNILQFRGQTSPWLEPAPGAASLNLFKMTREGLLVDLRATIQKARASGEPVAKEGIRMVRDGKMQPVEIEVLPLRNSQFGQNFYLVLFRAAAPPRPDVAETAQPTVPLASDSGEIAKLMQDLAATKEYLESVIEEQEASNEELRSANEEIQSSNEELQSTNEELQTAKEELQSTNEELHTVNDELENRNAELGRLNDDLTNLLSSINIPMVMLDNERKIRRFTPMAEKVLSLIPSDIGRPLRDINPNIDVRDLDSILLDVTETLRIHESEVMDAKGRWHSMRIRPYKTSGNRIDGVVLVLVEIDELKRTLEEVRRSRDFTAAIFETIREPLVVLNSGLRVKTANPAFYQMFHVASRDIENIPFYEFASGQWNIPKLRSLLEEILPRKTRFEDFELEHEFPGIGIKTLLLNARKLPQLDDAGDLILLAIDDITERKRGDDLLIQTYEAELREVARAYDVSAALPRKANPEGNVAREPDMTLQRTREELQALTANLIHVQDGERRRLSRELHDHLNQRLAMLEVEVQGVEQRSPDSLIRDQLRSVRSQVAELSDDVRRVAYQLHPSSLDHLGLVIALRSYCAEFARREAIRVKFTHQKVPQPLPQEIASCLYRITEEALRNVAKHGRTKLATVMVSGRDRNIQLAIRDFGVGFDPAANHKRAGLGIISMEERVRLVGGQLSVVSRPGEGTRIKVNVPLPPEVGEPTPDSPKGDQSQ